jgi:hypothetical protein
MTSWANKIATLLSDHFIGHLGGETYIICKMENPNDFNRVQVSFAAPAAQDEISPQPQSPAPKVILPGLHPSKPWNRTRR